MIEPGPLDSVPIAASTPRKPAPLEPVPLGPVPIEGGRPLVRLAPDHPGFLDPGYRARRDAIATLALAYRGGPVPRVEYTPSEHAVWGEVWRCLGPLHLRWACREYRSASARLSLSQTVIPQLDQVNSQLVGETGYTMVPVAGLVTPRAFLTELGECVFLATQYVRHGSCPHYTPEPDVIHELIGHAATLACPELAELSRALGAKAAGAGEPELLAIERVYWYTLEFGLVLERGEPKALGAGLLSSSGEIARLAGAASLSGWDLARMAETPYDPTGYQPLLFAAPSLRRLVEDLGAWTAKD